MLENILKKNKNCKHAVSKVFKFCALSSKFTQMKKKRKPQQGQSHSLVKNYILFTDHCSGYEYKVKNILLKLEMK